MQPNFPTTEQPSQNKNKISNWNSPFPRKVVAIRNIDNFENCPLISSENVNLFSQLTVQGRVRVEHRQHNHHYTSQGSTKNTSFPQNAITYKWTHWMAAKLPMWSDQKSLVSIPDHMIIVHWTEGNREYNSGWSIVPKLNLSASVTVNTMLVVTWSRLIN